LSNKKAPWYDGQGSQLPASDRTLKQTKEAIVMNYTQNQKISQISSHTLIIGVDIAKFKHVARAQDFRGVDLGKPLTFENNKEGFDGFT